MSESRSTNAAPPGRHRRAYYDEREVAIHVGLPKALALAGIDVASVDLYELAEHMVAHSTANAGRSRWWIVPMTSSALRDLTSKTNG